MPPSGIWRRVALVRTGVTEESFSSIIRAVTISELTVFLRNVLQLLVTVNVPSALIFSTLMMEAIYSPEASVLRRVMRSPRRRRFSR
jgi:hypothetical protein